MRREKGKGKGKGGKAGRREEKGEGCIHYMQD